MCGFFGAFFLSGNLAQHKESIIQSGELLSHRGPDDFGCYFDDYWGVYFRRLSIIDISQSGHQPMVSDDQTIVLSFNGEIYNYLELRKLLSTKGYQFKTQSDTEVLLKCYQEFGTSCVDHFRGMFAFVIWDREQRCLHLFRDRVGIKPLFICQHGDLHLVSSEIKSIKSFLNGEIRQNDEIAYRYLAKGWLDDTDETFYKNIRSVPPGTHIQIDKFGIREKKYWTLDFNGRGNFDPVKMYHEFSQALKLHLRSDVPLASTLSGGMDSSSIVSVAALINSGDEAIQAYSVLPPKTVDESFWIDKVINQTGIRHEYLDISFSDMSKTINEVIRFHDEPIHSSNCIYQFLLRKKISEQKIKVLLVGEGGDEVFGGYERFIFPFLLSLKKEGRVVEFNLALKGATSFLNSDERNIVAQIDKYQRIIDNKEIGQENMTAYDLFSSDCLEKFQKITNETHYPEIFPVKNNFFLAHLNLHLFTRDIPYVLRMEDRNSMAFSIEARVPFLDHLLMENVFSHDYALFMRGGTNKAMLRESMVPYVAREVVKRKDKSGRPGNDAHIMYSILKEEMSDLTAGTQPQMFKSSIKDLFQQDCKDWNPFRAEAWFRYFVFMKWQAMV